MGKVPLKRDINIAANDPFWVEVAKQEHPFTAMITSHSRGTCLISNGGVRVQLPPSANVGYVYIAAIGHKRNYFTEKL